MQSNPPQAKFCLISDSNRLLINFFDPISGVQFTRRDDSIQIRTRIRSKKSIKIDFFDLVIDFFDLLIDFFDH